MFSLEAGKGGCLHNIKFKLIQKLRSMKGYCVLPISSFAQWEQKISFNISQCPNILSRVFTNKLLERYLGMRPCGDLYMVVAV